MPRTYTVTLPANPELHGLARVTPDIVYTQRPGQDLTLQLITPWAADLPQPEGTAPKRFPTVLFVQGSAWTTPDPWYQLPQLGQLAQRGFIVATLTHRSIKNGHAAPAFLKDTKAALRFLRHYADRLYIDPERIGIWGTSSGGNAALLAALTADDPDLRTHDYPEQSDRVAVCIDCFGPTDVYRQFSMNDPVTAESYGRLLTNNYDRPFSVDDLTFMSPLHQIDPNKKYPPFLLIHGTADTLVTYEQSTALHERLTEIGAQSDLVTIPDAPHEGSFWSQPLLDLIFDYLGDYL